MQAIFWPRNIKNALTFQYLQLKKVYGYWFQPRNLEEK